jgi:hypothetical protein
VEAAVVTENEKLRALLAEAREWVRTQGEAGCPDDQCEQCAAADEMLQRIDATLAEPVVDDEYHKAAFRWFDDCMRARKERDEARAEVERLREAVNAWAKTAEWNYQRGAEAMREAAARNCAGEVCSQQIRNLPIPEDKP